MCGSNARVSSAYRLPHINWSPIPHHICVSSHTRLLTPPTLTQVTLRDLFICLNLKILLWLLWSSLTYDNFDFTKDACEIRQVFHCVFSLFWFIFNSIRQRRVDNSYATGDYFLIRSDFLFSLLELGCESQQYFSYFSYSNFRWIMEGSFVNKIRKIVKYSVYRIKQIRRNNYSRKQNGYLISFIASAETAVRYANRAKCATILFVIPNFVLISVQPMSDPSLAHHILPMGIFCVFSKSTLSEFRNRFAHSSVRLILCGCGHSHNILCMHPNANKGSSLWTLFFIMIVSCFLYLYLWSYILFLFQTLDKQVMCY